MKRKRKHLKFGKKKGGGGGGKGEFKKKKQVGNNRNESRDEPKRKRRKISHFIEVVSLPFSATKEEFLRFLKQSNIPFISLKFPLTAQKTTVGHCFVEFNDESTKKQFLKTELFFKNRKIRFIEPYKMITALQLSHFWGGGGGRRNKKMSEEDHWKSFFEQVGTITDFQYFRHNQSAYITFENFESVDKAVVKFHKKRVGGGEAKKQVLDGMIHPPSGGGQIRVLRGKLPIRFCVYVSGFKYGTSKRDIAEIFKDCGKITNIKLSFDHAFLTFENEESLEIAIGKNGMVLDDSGIREEKDEDKDDDKEEEEEEGEDTRKRLVVEIKLGKSGIIRKQMARKKRKRRWETREEEEEEEEEKDDSRKRKKAGSSTVQFSEGNSVFIGNLPFNLADDSELRSFLETCGEIENLMLMKGFAFVQFKDLSGVRNALKLDKSEFEGRMLHIEKKKRKKK